MKAILWLGGAGLLVRMALVGASGGVLAERLAQVDEAGVLRWQDTAEELALFGVNYPWCGTRRDRHGSRTSP